MKNLVICCAGDQSLHPSWSDKDRDFDLLLIHYGEIEEKWKDSADYYLSRKGPKWHLVYHAAQVFAEELSQYKAVWIPDDDIASDPRSVNALFRCFNRHPLALAQPALTFSSYVNHHITRRRILTFLRYTNFVEIMAPIMKMEIFIHLSKSFELNMTGWGLDYLWASIIEKEGLGNIAIIDRFPICHTRPVNTASGYYAKMQLNPDEEMRQLMEGFGLSTKKKTYRRIYRESL